MKFIDRLKHGKKPTIYGDGEQTRDFVFVGDVVDACLRAMRCKNCVGEVINVGSGREITISELAKILIRLFKAHKVKPVYTKSKAGDIKRSCADISRARKLLGYEPKVSLVERLKRLLIEYGINNDCK
jgi:nucleoside-diphosphate-sugar epimerase